MKPCRRWLCVSCVGALACSANGAAPAPLSQQAHLPAAVAAQVGSDPIALSTVARIAQVQGVSLQVARARAVSDALFAAAARSRLAERGLLPVAERSAFARAVLEGLKADALARGPATEAELTELTARRWQDFDRPPSSRTMHAVVLVDAPASDAKARAVAERIRSAVLGITDPEAFMTAARAVPHEGVEVRVERLPAVTPDGRTYYPEGAPPDAADQRFDPAFARAANELAVGQISEPTKSAFGYHVILCEAHLPELRVSAAERRVRLNDQLLKQRAEAAKQALLKELSARGSVQIARSADDLTARVQVIE
ncbi:MAG: peptidylprolyl isomerase [Pseudomonadota bacterium]